MGTAKVLIVDDEEAILTMLEMELTSEGYEVLKAQNGEEAISQVKHVVPDLIIMDILLPDMDGTQAIKILRSELKMKNIPVLFLTAILTKEEADSETLSVKVDNAYFHAVAKPFEPEDLLKAINRVICKINPQ